MRASRLLVLVLACLPFLIGLSDSAVWDSNEAFYVQTPREMVESGDWIVPTFNGRLRLNKPPLSYWLVAAGYEVFGVSLAVERWVMALLALGCVGLLYATARMTLERSQAVLATAIFATTFRFLILSRRLLIDVLLLACVLLVLYFSVLWLIRGSRRGFVAAAAAVGLGCLAKGPVAFLPLLPLGVYLLLGRGMGRQRPAPWLAALGVGAAVSSSWFLLLAYRLGWEPVFSFFLTENLGRFSNLDFGPARGVFYYVGVFLGDFFPWSVLFVAALFIRVRKGLAAPVQEPVERLWLLWVAVYLVVFSLSHNKQEYYILPVYPVAALWLAPRLEQLLEVRILRAVIGLLIAGAVVLLGFVAEPMVGSWYWVPLLLLAMAVVALWCRSSAGLVAGLSVAFAAAFALYLKPLDRFQPVPRLAARYERLSAERGQSGQSRVGYYKLAVPSMRFYLDEDIEELSAEEDAVEMLGDSRPAYLVIGAAELAPLQSRLGPKLRIEGVEVKLYTTARALLQGAGLEPAVPADQPWTRPVYLVSNQGP